MKKILLEIENYLSNFWVILSIIFAMSIFFIWRAPIFFWFSNNYKINFFGDFLFKIENYYLLILFYVLLPFAVFFLILSIFIWIYYHRDEIIRKIGFKNIIIIIFAIFLLFLLPAQAVITSYKINSYQEEKIRDAAKSKEGYITGPPSSFEIYKLYQSLADDGIQSWRTNALAVVGNELKEGGCLHQFNRDKNDLLLKSEEIDESTGLWKAIVELKNNYHDIEIILSKYLRNDKSGIWRVKQYKKNSSNNLL